LRVAITYIALFIAVFTAIIPGQSLSELHKIPALVNHYKQHQVANLDKEMGFLDFLLMHYKQGSSHKQEENHEDLPFFHNCCAGILYTHHLVQIAIFSMVEQPHLLTQEVKNEYTYNRHHSIFQPPRYES
jgi:hypothetical protein